MKNITQQNKLKIVEISNYILTVSLEKIKEDDYQLIPMLSEIQKVTKDNINLSYMGYKIIAHKPKNNAPVLNIPLLPNIENNVEMLAWETKCLSRKEVYELFNKVVFKEKRLNGIYSISASKQIHEFNEKLRELAKNNIKISTKSIIPTYFLLEKIENNNCIGKYLFE